MISEIKSRATNIIAATLRVNRNKVTLASRFTNDLGADSLDIVEVIVELEREFNITIPDYQVDNVVTVGEAISYIEENLRQ